MFSINKMDICINCPQCGNQNIYHIFELYQSTIVNFICNYCNISFSHTINPINVSHNECQRESHCLPICIPIPCSIL